MGNVLVGGIYVVQATKGHQVEYWAAATIREKAVAAVEKELGGGWTLVLTDRRLTGQRLSRLGLRPNSVQRLGTAFLRRPVARQQLPLVSNPKQPFALPQVLRLNGKSVGFVGELLSFVDSHHGH
jgi:hypothetical protein